MNIIGFRTNIGTGRMEEGETEEGFCGECHVFLKLHEGNIIEGNAINVTDYDNDTGMATVMFERSISQATAETLLDRHDIFLFDGFDD